MSSSKKSSKENEPSQNPYETLNIPHTSTDAEISRAYKKLALKLHPDKLRHQQKKKKLSEAELEKLAHQFHNIKEAKSFLLDAEHKEARIKYDLKLKSEMVRKQQDEVRERHMTDRRRKLREELRKKEQKAALRRDGNEEEEEETAKRMFDKLRKEGQNLRESLQTKRTAAEITARKKKAAAAAKERLIRTNELQSRQIRLKWKSSKISHSEHTIASLLSKHGKVLEVEIVGHKGNAALVTFENDASCGLCVEEYKESDVMRATFVGNRKQEEIRKSFLKTKDDGDGVVGDDKFDSETLQDRKVRQAAEREKLLRQMEMEEGEGVEVERENDVSFSKRRKAANTATTYYPPHFPSSSSDVSISSFEKLKQLEQKLFQKLASKQQQQQQQQQQELMENTVKLMSAN